MSGCFTNLEWPFDKCAQLPPGGCYAMLRRRSGRLGEGKRNTIPEIVQGYGMDIGDLVFLHQEELVLNEVQKSSMIYEVLEEEGYRNKRRVNFNMFSDAYSDLKQISEDKGKVWVSERIKSQLGSNVIDGNSIFTIYYPGCPTPIKFFEAELVLLSKETLDAMVEEEIVLPVTYLEKTKDFKEKKTIYDYPFCNDEEKKAIVENFMLDGMSLNAAVNEAIKIGMIDLQYSQPNIPLVWYKMKKEAREYFENINWI